MNYPTRNTELIYYPSDYEVEYVNLANMLINDNINNISVESELTLTKKILDMISNISNIKYNQLVEYYNFLIDNPDINIEELIEIRNEYYKMEIYNFEFFTQPYYTKIQSYENIGFNAFIVRLNENGEYYKTNGLLKIDCNKDTWLDNIINIVKTNCINTYAWMLIFPDAIKNFDINTIEFIKNEINGKIFQEDDGSFQQLITQVKPNEYEQYEPSLHLTVTKYNRSELGKHVCFYGGIFAINDNCYKITNGVTNFYNFSFLIV